MHTGTVLEGLVWYSGAQRRGAERARMLACCQFETYVWSGRFYFQKIRPTASCVDQLRSQIVPQSDCNKWRRQEAPLF